MKNFQFDRICVIGLGYIGLPTAATFAAHDIEVVGVDVNKNVIDLINQGKIHIVEPELDTLVRKVVGQSKLKAQTKPADADAYIIAVPTPFKEGHEPDLSYIKAASKSIAPFLKPGNLVILESTSPVGATEQMAEWLSEARPDLTFPQSAEDNADIMIAHCPERVLPGKVLQELISNDRIVGGMTEKSSTAACALYRAFVKGSCITTNVRTAEMCKLIENSYRDVNIAFANELSIICDKLSINVWELIALANRHPRVNILQPGPGVGGHCIAVDPWFIVSKTPKESQLIYCARKINDSKPYWVVNKVCDKVLGILKNNPDRSIKDIFITCYGLAFKPNIDDLRESPAVLIVEILLKKGFNVFVNEPNITSLPDNLKSFDNVKLLDKYEEKESDINLILVNHSEYSNLSLSNLTIDVVGAYL